MSRLLIIFTLLLLASCGGDKESLAGKKITVAFTCDVKAKLEPCGCFTGQFGGLSRISTRLQKFDADRSLVIVDAGDAISGKEDYDLIAYEHVLQAFKLMKYDAVNAGQREASLSLAQWKSLDLSQGAPVISANLFETASGKALLQRTVMIERDGIKIGITGIVDPALLGEGLGAGIEARDIDSSLTQVLPELKDADVRILLAFCTVDRMRELAGKFYEFDFILGGKVTQPSQKLLRENRSTILFTTNEAKNMGFVHAEMKEKGGLKVEDFDVQLMYPTVSEDKDIIAISQKYREKIASTKLQVDNPHALTDALIPGVQMQASYVGTQTCAACHSSAHAKWEKSAHAHAFKALETKQASADPRCISCHTVGFGQKDGYLRSFGKEKMVNVGCESCHGPGSEHVRQRSGTTPVYHKYRPLGEGDCRSCHYGEFSRPFKWKERWPLIAHGKESKMKDQNLKIKDIIKKAKP